MKVREASIIAKKLNCVNMMKDLYKECAWNKYKY